MRTTYTTEEDCFLITNFENYSWERLTELLNAKFGTSRNFRTVKCHCRKTLNLKKVKNACEYAQIPSDEIGTEKWENGFLWVKINNLKGSRKTRSVQQNWVQKHRFIWSQKYGEIPKECQIVFLDGDRTNFDIENLYCVNTSIMTRMNRNHWFTESREHTLTAIKLCELHFALKESEG